MSDQFGLDAFEARLGIAQQIGSSHYRTVEGLQGILLCNYGHCMSSHPLKVLTCYKSMKDIMMMMMIYVGVCTGQLILDSPVLLILIIVGKVEPGGIVSQEEEGLQEGGGGGHCQARK